MNQLCHVLWLSITILITNAYPNQRPAVEQRPFRIGGDPNEPQWRNTTSQQGFSITTNRVKARQHDTSLLKRQNPDAVSIHVDPNHNFAWTPIKLGSQQLGVMLDIGSTAFWVFSAQDASAQPSGLLPYTQLYTPGNSPTWQSLPNATFSSGYMAGFTANGVVGTESLSVGQLPAVTQHVGVMWWDKPTMDPQQIQGILGLGLSSDRSSGTMGMPTYLDLLMPMMEPKLFTIAIDKWGTGIWSFGHIDPSKYTGDLRTVPVNDDCATGGSWKVGGVSAQFAEGTMFPAAGCGMFDTGFDLLTLDAALVARYYADVPGANTNTLPGQYTFPCDSPLPDLTLSIGDKGGIVIPGHWLNYHPFDEGANVCSGALQSAGEGGTAVFGQVFMMAQFMVFDIGARTVGFATIAGES